MQSLIPAWGTCFWYQSPHINHLVIMKSFVFKVYWSFWNPIVGSEMYIGMSSRKPSISSQLLPSWWRHQMETFYALLALQCAGNSLVTGEFPAHKSQWRGALMFTLVCAWMNGWVNNREAGDWRRHCTQYDITVWFCCAGIPLSTWLWKSPFNSHETARYGEIASAILIFFVCCMEMG